MVQVQWTEARKQRGELVNLYKSREFKTLRGAQAFADRLRAKANTTDVAVRA